MINRILQRINRDEIVPAGEISSFAALIEDLKMGVRAFRGILKGNTKDIGVYGLQVDGDASVAGSLDVTGNLSTSGTTSLDGAVVINESGADVDMRVESDGNANAIMVDGGLDAVGIMGVGVEGNALTVYSDVVVLHTATSADEHAVEIDADAAGFGDVKAIDIDYITGAIAPGEDEGVILINIDETLATGGDIFAVEVLATDGDAGIYGLKAGALVGPIHQNSGTFANPTTATDNTIGSSVTDTSIGFTQTPDTITDSNSGFGNFVVGEIVVVTGATTGANNTTYTITVATAGALTVTPQPNTVENDGATITVDGKVPAMMDDSTGTTTAIFEADNEYVIIGAAAAFQEMELVLTTASSKNIKPTFWYSTAGAGQFSQFTPVDGTDGCLHTGVIAWDASDLTSHVANSTTGTFDIKMIRTKGGSITNPILGYAKIATTTEYLWDKDGDVNIKDLTAAGNIAVSGTVDGIDIATDVAANTTHRGSSGADHSYIDQDVAIASTPVFAGATIGGMQITGDGTSFPGTPATNDLFYRTDLGWLCYYDGTRWLTTWEDSYFIEQTLYTGTANPLTVVPRHDYSVYISRVVFNSYVVTTNDGTDHWDMYVTGNNQAGGSSDDAIALTTDSDSPDAHTAHEAVATKPIPDYTYRLLVRLIKINSPGNIYFTGTVYYKLVVT